LNTETQEEKVELGTQELMNKKEKLLVFITFLIS